MNNPVVTIATLAMATAAAIGAYAETCADKLTTNSGASELLKCIQQMEITLSADAEVPMRIPVGTVLASLLPPRVFAQSVGDPPDYDPTLSRWALADDRGKMPGTTWAELTNNEPIPDLRAMFLRGMNVGRTDKYRDPVGDRKPGHSQPDELDSHTHRYGSHAGAGSDSATAGDGRVQQVSPPGAFETHSSGNGQETMPKNKVVYFYIRVN